MRVTEIKKNNSRVEEYISYPLYRRFMNNLIEKEEYFMGNHEAIEKAIAGENTV